MTNLLRVSIVKFKLSDQEFGVLLDAKSVAICEMSPKFAHLCDHVPTTEFYGTVNEKQKK
jgi:hypothetical protein